MATFNTTNISQIGNLDGSGNIQAGEFRRKFALGEKVTKLAIDESPFFRLATMLRRFPTNDPEFKSMEERSQWHRRYFYVVGQTNGGTNELSDSENSWSKTAWDALRAGSTLPGVHIAADYDKFGKFKLVGNENTNSIFGSANSKPTWVFAGQLIKIPVSLFINGTGITQNDYILAEVTSVADFSAAATEVSATLAATASSSNVVTLGLNVLRWPSTATIPATLAGASDKVYVGLGVPGQADTYTGSNKLIAARDLTAGLTASTTRREDRCYIAGNAHEEGSGLPNVGWMDKLSDTYGFTQIFKEDFSMNNTARATVLRGIPNEYKKQWYKHTLIHKRDIEHTSMWGVKATNTSGSNIKRYTQGAIDFITQNGFIFGMTEGKTFDNFTTDLGEFFHPEVQNKKATVYFCSTQAFNWLNGVGTGSMISNSVDASNTGFRSNLTVEGKKKVFGVNITDISTIHGTIHLTKNVQLDGTGIHIVAVDMSNIMYRPLVGNGLNRDTTIYMGVKSIEHTGDDLRTDLIQTEAGFDFCMGETMAIWKS